MMLKRLFFLCVLLSSVLCINRFAQAKDFYYVKTSLGTGISNKLATEDYDKKRIKNSRIINLAFGKELNRNVDIDIGTYFVDKQVFKYTVRDTPVRQKFTSRAFILSGTYNFEVPCLVSPYISLGAGVSRNKAGDYLLANTQDIQYGKRTNSFAYTFAGGAKYRKEPVEIFLEYRHLNLGKFSTTDTITIQFAGLSTTYTDTPNKTRIRYNTINFGFKVLF